MTPPVIAGLVLGSLLAASVGVNAYLHHRLGNALEALGAAQTDARQAGAAAGQCSAGVTAARQAGEARAAAAARRTAAAERRAAEAEAEAIAVLSSAPGAPDGCSALTGLNAARIRARNAP